MIRPSNELDATLIIYNYSPRRGGNFVIPTPGIFDNQTYCLRVNQDWLPHLIGAMWALDQPDAWSGTDEEIENARNEIRRLVASIEICIEDDMYLLRQSPTSDCILEQSVDGGETWATAFDFSLCIPQSTPTTIDITTYILDMASLYDSMLIAWLVYESIKRPEIAPQMTDYDDNAAGHQHAICASVEIMVRSFCLAMKDQLNNNERSEAQFLAAVFAATSGATGAWAAAAGGVGLLLGTAGVAAFLSFGFALATIVQIVRSETVSGETAVYEDEQAIENVICCLYSDLITALSPTGDITFEGWQGALSDFCNADEDSNTYNLAYALYTWKDNINVFIGFWKSVNEMMDIDPGGTEGFFWCRCSDVLTDCVEDFSAYYNWVSVGATPAGWTSPATTPPQIPHPESYTQLTRSSETMWDAAGSTYRTSVVMNEFAEPTTIDHLAMRARFDTTNQNLLNVSYRVNDVWFSGGTINPQSPANVVQTLNASIETICVEAVRYVVWGTGARIEYCTINSPI